MLDRFEKLLRRSAMWAYALNQSRAKVVMDPIYLATAKMLLRGTNQPSTKLMTETFAPNLYLPYRSLSRKLAYWIVARLRARAVRHPVKRVLWLLPGERLEHRLCVEARFRLTHPEPHGVLAES
jgi:hypothetical protein